MSGITNTTKKAQDDPLGVVGGAFVMGTSGFIENQEAHGQRQLVASSLLPTQSHNSDAEFEALGFTFGEPVEGDDLFRHATLPEGWQREGTDHSMHSVILDERGIERVSIFYKAAFYDRRADMVIANVGGGAARGLVYSDKPIPWDALTDTEKADAVASLQDIVGKGVEYPDIYGEQAKKATAELEAIGAI